MSRLSDMNEKMIVDVTRLYKAAQLALLIAELDIWGENPMPASGWEWVVKEKHRLLGTGSLGCLADLRSFVDHMDESYGITP
jgi:hypothetical protein